MIRLTNFVLLMTVTQGLCTSTESPRRETTAANSHDGREVNTTSQPLPQYRCTVQSCGGKEYPSLYRKINQFRTDYPGLFVTRCDLFKVNWCQSHAAQCPGGLFPDNSSALSYSLKRNCGRYNKELPPSVRRPGAQSSRTVTTASLENTTSTNNATPGNSNTRNSQVERENSRTRSSSRHVTTSSPRRISTTSTNNATSGSPRTRNTQNLRNVPTRVSDGRSTTTHSPRSTSSSNGTLGSSATTISQMLRANSRARGSGRRATTQSPGNTRSSNTTTLGSPIARDSPVLRASRPRVANRRVVESTGSSISLNSLRDEVQGDRDRCCQTKNEVVIMAGPMVDHRNETCQVISLNDQFYQFAHVGSCYQENEGGCDGTCVQERRLVSLLCLEPVPGSQDNLRPVFRFFHLNAYCSCRSGAGL